MSLVRALSPQVEVQHVGGGLCELTGPSGILVVPENFAEAITQNEVSPSGEGINAKLAQRLSDGGFLSVTAYDGDRPLATLVPGVRPIVDMPVNALRTSAYRLSRFAYLHRVKNDMVLEIPTTSAYVQIHDPLAAAVIAGLAFDQTPERLAITCGLSVGGVCEVLGLMKAIGIVMPVSRGLDFVPAMKSLMEWAVSEALPPGHQTQDIRKVLENIRHEDVDAGFHIGFELHHDGSGRVDICLALPYQGKGTSGDRALLGDRGFYEFDVVNGQETLMGVFVSVMQPEMPLDPMEEIQRVDETLAALGTGCRVSANSSALNLISLLGMPQMMATLPGRDDAIRMLFSIPDAKKLERASQILDQAGVAGVSGQRVAALEPLVGGESTLRLAVDMTPLGLGPRVGIEVFDPQALGLLGPVLEDLGVDRAMIQEAVTVIAMPARERTVFQETGNSSTSDVPAARQTVIIHHAKVGFEPSGDVVVKTYVVARNTTFDQVGKSVEDADIPMSWEFHDLLFHSKSRNGRARGKLGGSARFTVMPPLEMPSTQAFPGDLLLPAVNIASVIASDDPFGQVLERRESGYEWDGCELPVGDVAELLARVMHIIPRQVPGSDGNTERAGRVYPSGGGRYEIDIVVFADRVAGLAPGAYLYRPGSHSLGSLQGSKFERGKVLFGASEATGATMARPQALLVLAARFPDLALKYEGLAYALMLKHVGVMMATIQYSATAMGLSSVCLGAGDSDAFALATGLNYYRHGSIGEVAISPRP